MAVCRAAQVVTDAKVVVPVVYPGAAYPRHRETTSILPPLLYDTWYRVSWFLCWSSDSEFLRTMVVSRSLQD